jgi:pimeloyl-ACP methyl ester carboxylesterase
MGARTRLFILSIIRHMLTGERRAMGRRGFTRRLVLVTAAIGTFASGIAAAGPALAAGPAPAAHRSPLAWGACGAGVPSQFQCATAAAPLDYANPGGQQIQLALIRLPASDPAQRIGSLFINWGGPGAAGISRLAARAYTVFSDAVRARFDLVSWDPRAIGQSTAVRCFATQADSDAFFNAIPAFPNDPSQDSSFFAQYTQLGQDCEQRSGTLLPHMSSADTARDLGLLRQDVGDAKLNYIGFSYGTVIGATYANLFPGNVRAMILDGTLDFVGNATGHNPGDGSRFPVDVRQGVDLAGQDTFNRFMGLCAQAGTANCPFAQGGDLPGKWATLLSRVKVSPITLSDGSVWDYQTLVATVYYDIYRPIADWGSIATLLQDLYATASASGHAAAPRARLSTAQLRLLRADEQYLNNASEAYAAIQCADSVLPTSTDVYHNLGISENRKVPGFGRLVVFDMEQCATWPAMHTDAYDGPWNLSRTPILVVNSLHDPATPIWGAREAVRELGNARLLTVNGDGHTSMFSEPSACRENAKLAYLVSGTLPAEGTVCEVDQLPFGLK